MNENLMEAREELKRLDHIIHVTLKYTRTIDVIRNALRRLISYFDFLIFAFLEDAEDKGTIASVPKSPYLRSSLLLEAFPDDEELHKFMIFYTFLRDTLNADFTRREEYRRHVTLVVDAGGKTAEIDIDSLESCEKVANSFFDYARQKLDGK